MELKDKKMVVAIIVVSVSALLWLGVILPRIEVWEPIFLIKEGIKVFITAYVITGWLIRKVYRILSK